MPMTRFSSLVAELYEDFINLQKITVASKVNVSSLSDVGISLVVFCYYKF